MHRECLVIILKVERKKIYRDNNKKKYLVEMTEIKI